jgi:hypothetical protein
MKDLNKMTFAEIDELEKKIKQIKACKRKTHRIILEVDFVELQTPQCKDCDLYYVDALVEHIEECLLQTFEDSGLKEIRFPSLETYDKIS